MSIAFLDRSVWGRALFIAGLAVRVALILCVLPKAAAEWYVPFLEHSIQFPSFDPWTDFTQSGGSSMAFPYGYAMWLLFLPLTLLASALHLPLYYGYGFTLLIADLLMLGVLAKLFNRKPQDLLVVYWLSPILLFATYWLGYNDLIPILLLMIGLLFLKTRAAGKAGIFYAAAVSAKFSMVLALPLAAIYLYRNKHAHALIRPAAISFFVSSLVLGLPFALSHTALQAVLQNPELQKSYDWSIRYGAHAEIYLLPLVYALSCYMAWRIRRISFPLFLVLQGMPFFIVLLMTPAAPGWFIWTLPLLTLHQLDRRRHGVFHVAAFSGFYLACSLLTMPLPSVLGQPPLAELLARVQALLGARGISLLHTGLMAAGIVLTVRIWRDGVKANDYFRISRKPLMLGIAGDSGAGKDTLVDALTGLFGTISVSSVSGDDYHRWDRNTPMWQVMTHLNPQANDLNMFARDALALAAGKHVHQRHYDHAQGKKSKPRLLRSNDVILVSGLHALYPHALLSRYDLSVFLDIDESLRRHFKIQRDVHQRGHSIDNVLQAFERRAADAARFIAPQTGKADLVLSLQPIHPRFVTQTDTAQSIPMKLCIRARNGFHEETLQRALIGLCNLQVDVVHTSDATVEMTIDGEVSAEDVAFAAATTLGRMQELMSCAPQWHDGMLGVMQLVVLSHTQQALQERIR